MARPSRRCDVDWEPLTVNEQVIRLNRSGQLANAIAIIGIHSDAVSAKGDRAGLKRRTYRDGAVIEYDSVAQQLRAQLTGA